MDVMASSDYQETLWFYSILKIEGRKRNKKIEFFI